MKPSDILNIYPERHNWRLKLHERFNLFHPDLSFQFMELIHIKSISGIDGGVHITDRETGEVILRLNAEEVNSSYVSDDVWYRLEQEIHDHIVMRMRFQGKLKSIVWC